MARLAYIRCQRKQEIEEFEQQAQADKVFIDLADEYGVTLGNSLGVMFDNLMDGDKVIVRKLSELADTVAELRSLMVTLRDIGAEIAPLNSVSSGVLSDEGFEMLSFVETFIKEKEKIQRERQSRQGRPVQPYPSNFLEVYTGYRNKEFNGLEAAKKLSVNYDKFRELIKVFELRV
ncbi:hypothetical protein [Paenibacillus sp. DYY-L-2]|uniref:hypothetical protein n=1 Tax=Paenibacillus sp. DYY-L-2 TaxID=3447013 RepID=UPI003F4FA88D